MAENENVSVMPVQPLAVVGENAPRLSPNAAAADAVDHAVDDVVIDIKNLSLWYGKAKAIEGVTMLIPRQRVTALIGPSGCGKSTLLRCLNRMNELIPAVKVEGEITLDSQNIMAAGIDPVEVRRHVGMVFQKPNPFPKSIYENVAFGARVNGYQGDMDELVRFALERAALWDEVKDKLKQSGLALSGGQQQRLCIARAIAVKPAVVLMDEPCSALDPIATQRIEDLMRDLAKEYTIVIVTHNMQQAARVSDRAAFMLAGDERIGRLVEYRQTEELFTNPRDQRTEDYITGRFG
ncbi:MAG: phosphate ABC transporter ATP-binding protein [Chloroflexi bacterium]|nr:MAG: phosphate ABC transporter ATP-binding protein [Chloroflexota bacterium]